MRSMPDQVEPDGLPNPAGIQTSTLKSNVWYHKGLAHYLKGEFNKAAGSYQKALDLDLTDDMRIATLYWHYMALRRMGHDEEAGGVIAEISSDLELLENDASSARPEGSMAVEKVIWWKHNSKAGQCSSAKVHGSLTVNADGTYAIADTCFAPEVIEGF